MTTPVLVASLKIGMFVAELDRPWSETPFLTEGFLIVEADQLELLRTYCRRVFIDPLRSSPESLSHLGDLRGKQKDAGWDGDHAFEQALSRIFSEWKKKHLINSVLTGKMARAAHFIEQRVLATLGQAEQTGALQVPQFAWCAGRDAACTTALSAYRATARECQRNAQEQSCD
jgi:hypothetical protein